jgi:hypothetical protein
VLAMKKQTQYVCTSFADRDLSAGIYRYGALFHIAQIAALCIPPAEHGTFPSYGISRLGNDIDRRSFSTRAHVKFGWLAFSRKYPCGTDISPDQISHSLFLSKGKLELMSYPIWPMNREPKLVLAR